MIQQTFSKPYIKPNFRVQKQTVLVQNHISAHSTNSVTLPIEHIWDSQWNATKTGIWDMILPWSTVLKTGAGWSKLYKTYVPFRPVLWACETPRPLSDGPTVSLCPQPGWTLTGQMFRKQVLSIWETYWTQNVWLRLTSSPSLPVT